MKRTLLVLFLTRFFIVNAVAQEAKLMLPIGHTFGGLNAIYSPDGKQIVTGSIDGSAKIWDAENGLLLANLINQSIVTDVKYSPDGKKIVTAASNGTITVWDSKNGNLLAEFQGQGTANGQSTASFSTDNKKIVILPEGNSAKIWGGESGDSVLTLDGHTDTVTSAIFSPDGRLIATCSYDRTAKIWNANNGTLLLTLTGHNAGLNDLQFSSDNTRLITVSKDGIAKIWDTANGDLLFTLRGHKAEITGVIFSPDSKKVVTTSADSTAKIWDVATGVLLHNFKDHKGKVIDAAFSSDGKKVITISFDKVAKIWDVSSGLPLKELKCSNCFTFSSAKFSSNNERIVTSSFPFGVFEVWDANSGSLVFDLKGHAGWPISTKYLSKDNYLATTVVNINSEIKNTKGINLNDRSILKIWDAESGNLKSTFNNVNFATFSGKSTVKFLQEGAIKIWDIDSQTLLAKRSIQAGTVKRMDGSVDFKKFVITDDKDNIKIWNINDKKPPMSLTGHHGKIYFTRYSKDGKKIVTAAADKTIKVWDPETGNLLTNIKANIDSTSDFDITEDGNKIFVVTYGKKDNMFETFDTNTGKVQFDLKERAGKFSSDGVISSNGTMILTSIADSSAKIWDAASGKLRFEILGINLFSKFSHDNNKLVSFSTQGKGYIRDTRDGKLLAVLRGHTAMVSSFEFSHDDKHIVSSSFDGTSKIWDSSTGQLLYTFFAVDSTDYLVTDQYGRYDGTEGARKLLYFTCGTEVIGLDQVKDQLWVPNLAERIMKGDSINAPKLSDLNICGLIPQVEKEDKTGYHFMITPQSGGLGETVLYVNDIEVKRYKPAQLTKTTTGYELNLSDQELQPYFIAGQQNPVTVKAYTANNDISSRGAKIIQDETNKQAVAPNMYAVMIGVSDYKGAELQLKYAAKDASDISDAMKASAGKFLGKEHVFIYNLTTAANHYQLPEKLAIKNVLAEIGKKATANDILLIFFAGHGVTSGEKKQFYFLTADASQASATDAPDQVGISTTELSDWMKPANIKAQKRILILDACNSGQAINELVKVGNADQNYIAARNDDKAEQIKAIDKLNEKSGLFILAASASNQSAYEMGRYSQGLLTYSLLKAIKQQPDILEDNKYLNVSRWFNAAEKTVSDMVRETGNRQEPQIVSAGNFNIGVVDQEVMAGIKLADEKPLFTACNFQNSAIDDDNLELSGLVNQSMNEMSARSADSQISYATASNSPDAWSLSGRYEVAGDDITVKINIKQNKEIKNKLELKGKKSDLKTLAEQVVSQATNWILKHK